jgi:hypothetical protein
MLTLRLLLLACVLAIQSSVASAQYPQQPRYTPARPTVSPYLNLLRRDAGPVPNYYSLVRPQLQQQAINQQVSTNLLQQEQNIGQLQDATLRLKASSMRATGTGGGFMNFSHYYNTTRPAIGRR